MKSCVIGRACKGSHRSAYDLCTCNNVTTRPLVNKNCLPTASAAAPFREHSTRYRLQTSMVGSNETAQVEHWLERGEHGSRVLKFYIMLYNMMRSAV